MKKIFVMALLCLLFNGLKAQYSISVATSPTMQYIYVGSLTLDEVNLGNYQKIKVEVLGGAWGSDTMGETTYHIGNRGGLQVHQISIDGYNDNFYTLQAFDNGNNNIDFYVVTINWTAIMVRSSMLGGSNPVTQLISSTVSSNLPSGTLHPITIKPFLISDENGNLAINTYAIDTDYALSVNGGIRAKEVTVETGWADYVFDKHYPIKSLKEVENYIHQNSHLPDVPSASDVQKNGIKVGETESLLLKKIEELTLYLIEKDKQIKAQKNRQARQDKKIQAILNRLNKFEIQQR